MMAEENRANCYLGLYTYTNDGRRVITQVHSLADDRLIKCPDVVLAPSSVAQGTFPPFGKIAFFTRDDHGIAFIRQDDARFEHLFLATVRPWTDFEESEEYKTCADYVTEKAGTEFYLTLKLECKKQIGSARLIVCDQCGKKTRYVAWFKMMMPVAHADGTKQLRYKSDLDARDVYLSNLEIGVSQTDDEGLLRRLFFLDETQSSSFCTLNTKLGATESEFFDNRKHWDRIGAFPRTLQKRPLPIEKFARGCGLSLKECWTRLLSAGSVTDTISGIELRALVDQGNAGWMVGQSRRDKGRYWKGTVRCPPPVGASAPNWVYGFYLPSRHQHILGYCRRWNAEKGEFEPSREDMPVEAPQWDTDRLAHDNGFQGALAYCGVDEKWHLVGGSEGVLLEVDYSDFVELENFNPEEQEEGTFYRRICQLRGSELTPKRRSEVDILRPAQVEVWFEKFEVGFSGISINPQTGKYFVGDLRWRSYGAYEGLSKVAVSFDLKDGDRKLHVSQSTSEGLLDIPLWSPIENFLDGLPAASKKNTIAIVDWDKLCGDASVSIIGFVHECPPDAKFKVKMNLEGEHFIVRSEGRYYVGFEFDRRSWSFGISSEGVREISYFDVMSEAEGLFTDTIVPSGGRDPCRCIQALMTKAKPIGVINDNQMTCVPAEPDVEVRVDGSGDYISVRIFVGYGDGYFLVESEQLPGKVWLADSEHAGTWKIRSEEIEKRIVDGLIKWGFVKAWSSDGDCFYELKGSRQINDFFAKGIPAMKQCGYQIIYSWYLEEQLKKFAPGSLGAPEQEDTVDADLLDDKSLECDGEVAEDEDLLSDYVQEEERSLSEKQGSVIGLNRKKNSSRTRWRSKFIGKGLIRKVITVEADGIFWVNEHKFKLTAGKAGKILDKLIEKQAKSEKNAKGRWIDFNRKDRMQFNRLKCLTDPKFTVDRFFKEIIVLKMKDGVIVEASFNEVLFRHR